MSVSSASPFPSMVWSQMDPSPSCELPSTAPVTENSPPRHPNSLQPTHRTARAAPSTMPKIEEEKEEDISPPPKPPGKNDPNDESTGAILNYIHKYWSEHPKMKIAEFKTETSSNFHHIKHAILPIVLKRTIDPEIITYCLENEASIPSNAIDLIWETGLPEETIEFLLEQILESIEKAASKASASTQFQQLVPQIKPQTLQTIIIRHKKNSSHPDPNAYIKCLTRQMGVTSTTFSLICQYCDVDVEWAQELMKLGATITQEVLDNALKFQTNPQKYPLSISPFFQWLLPQAAHLNKNIDSALMGQTDILFILELIKQDFKPSINSIEIACFYEIDIIVIKELLKNMSIIPPNTFALLCKYYPMDQARATELIGSGATITQEALDHTLQFQTSISFIQWIASQAQGLGLNRQLDPALEREIKPDEQTNAWLITELIRRRFSTSQDTIEIACRHKVELQTIQFLTTIAPISEDTLAIICKFYPMDKGWAIALITGGAKINQAVLTNTLSFQNNELFIEWVVVQAQKLNLDKEFDPAHIKQKTPELILWLLEQGFIPSENSIYSACKKRFPVNITRKLSQMAPMTRDTFALISANYLVDIDWANELMSRGATISQRVLDNFVAFFSQEEVEWILPQTSHLYKQLDPAIESRQDLDFINWLVDQDFLPSQHSIELACYHEADPAVIKLLISLGGIVTETLLDAIIAINEKAQQGLSGDELTSLVAKQSRYIELLTQALQPDDLAPPMDGLAQQPHDLAQQPDDLAPQPDDETPQPDDETPPTDEFDSDHEDTVFILETLNGHLNKLDIQES